MATFNRTLTLFSGPEALSLRLVDVPAHLFVLLAPYLAAGVALVQELARCPVLGPAPSSLASLIPLPAAHSLIKYNATSGPMIKIP